MLAHHAIKFDENYHARQRKKVAEKHLRDSYRAQSSREQPIQPINNSQSTPQVALPSVDINGKLTQSVRDYRRLHNLCLFDGGQHPTHLCPKLIEKCKKEVKPLPVDPATRTTKYE